MSETLLQVENLRTYFHTFRGVVKAVDGISFSLDAGQGWASRAAVNPLAAFPF